MYDDETATEVNINVASPEIKFAANPRQTEFRINELDDKGLQHERLISFDWGKTPQVTGLDNFTLEPLSNPEFVRKIQHHGFWSEFSASPIILQEGLAGGRSIRGTHPDFPGRIIKISGLGLVVADLEQNDLHIRPVKNSEKLDQHVAMGSIIVGRDGVIWGRPNINSPYGGYSKPEFEAKVSQTESYGSGYVNMIATAKQMHKDTWMLAYSIPESSLTPNQILFMEASEPDLKKLNLLAKSVHAVGREIRQNLHDKGIVHMQLHPGNWYVNFNEGMTDCRPFITDWSTAEDLNNLPEVNASAGYVKKAYANEILNGLSPVQKAKAIDLIKFLDPLVVETLDQSVKKISLDSSRERWDTWVLQASEVTGRERADIDEAASVRRGVEILAGVILGYSSEEFSDEKHKELTEILNKTAEEIAIDLSHRQGHENINSMDDVLNDEYCDFILKSTMSEIVQRCAVLMSANPEINISNKITSEKEDRLKLQQLEYVSYPKYRDGNPLDMSYKLKE